MVDDSLSRPKRALSDDAAETTVAGDALDDTSAPARGPRRLAEAGGTDTESRTIGAPAGAGDGSPEPDSTPASSGFPDDHVYFMRPSGRRQGSHDPGPPDVQPAADLEVADAPDLPADAPDLAADAPDLAADAPDLAADAPDLAAETPTPEETSEPAAETPFAAAASTPAAPRRHTALPGGPKLIVAWVTGVLVVALAVFGAVYQIGKDAPATSSTPTSSSPTPTTPPKASISVEHLITETEAQTVKAEAGWKVAATLPTVTAESPRIACLVADPDLPNPTMSSQRTLSTATPTGMALLHQLDTYSTAADAEKVFAARRTDVGLCNDVPTWIVGATTVSGLGDESASVTIAYQDAVVHYHTVLLVRVGTVVNSFDLANNTSAAAALPIAQAAGKVTARQCALAKGACPKTIEAVASVPAPAGTVGWLVASDIPRITPGQGLWTETDPAQISSSGTGCEDVSLKAVPGSKQALQRTYLLLQDSTAPQNFGVDTIVYTMPSAKAATTLMTTLTTNIADCADRMATAKVSQSASITGVGDSTLKVAGRRFIVTQKVGNDTQTYRVAVTATGNKVSYLLVNGTSTYTFAPDAWSRLALRAAQRAVQAG